MCVSVVPKKSMNEALIITNIGVNYDFQLNEIHFSQTFGETCSSLISESMTECYLDFQVSNNHQIQ